MLIAQAVTSTTTDFREVLISVASGVILLLVPLVVRFFAHISKDVREIKGVLITPEPTPLVPNPPEGLIDVVAGLVKTAGANLQGTVALIKDSKPDDGSSGRDVLNRIDQATKESP